LANSKWVKSAVKTVRDLLNSALTALTASTALFTLTPFQRCHFTSKLFLVKQNGQWLLA
jgi:hypothetical protein